MVFWYFYYDHTSRSGGAVGGVGIPFELAKRPSPPTVLHILPFQTGLVAHPRTSGVMQILHHRDFSRGPAFYGAKMAWAAGLGRAAAALSLLLLGRAGGTAHRAPPPAVHEARRGVGPHETPMTQPAFTVSNTRMYVSY